MLNKANNVAPHAGAWIETIERLGAVNMDYMRRAPRGRVD